MKKIVLSLAVVAALSLTTTSCKKAAETTDAMEVVEASAEAVSYKVDTAASTIEWKGGKVVGGSHNGTINIANGEVSVKDGAIEAGSFTIDMNSIAVADLTAETGKADLEAHLKGANADNADHFFNVAQFPEGKFEITSIVDNNVEGNLTLKGITKNVKFPATVTINENEVIIASEAFNIDRTVWGINYNNETMTDLAKDKVISNNIEIKLTVKAVK